MEKEKSKRINVSFTPEAYEQIEHIAAKENISLSEYVRDATLMRLNTNILNENMDFVCSVLRNQIRESLIPFENRIASMTAKTCIMSATAAFLTAETINRLVPYDRQEDVQVVYDKARKKAALYVKNNLK